MTHPLARRAGRAVAWQALGLAATRVISLVRFLVLAHLLAPDDFGLLAIGAVVIELLLSLTDVGMMTALTQAKDPDERAYDAVWTAEVGRAVAITGVVLAAAPYIAQAFGEPRATNILRGLALPTLVVALRSIREVDLARTLRFRPIAVMGLAASVTEAVVSLALARSLGVWALVAGALAAAVVGTALSYVLAPHRPRLRFDRSAARPLLAYGRWITLTNVLYIAGDFCLRAVVSRRLGSADLGLYYLANRLAMLPKFVAAEAIRPVAFPLFAQVREATDQVARIYRASLTAMAGLLLPAYALLIAITPMLVSDVLGARWAGSAPVIRLLAAAGLIGLVTECTVPLVTGLGRPHFATLLYGTRSALVIALVWWLAGAQGVVGAALAWLAGEVVVQAVAAASARRAVERPFAGLAAPVAAIATASAAGGAVAWVIGPRVGGVLGLLAASIPALLVTAGVLAILERRFQLGLSGLARSVPVLRALTRSAGVEPDGRPTAPPRTEAGSRT